jgi:hypothetical protein
MILSFFFASYSSLAQNYSPEHKSIVDKWNESTIKSIKNKLSNEKDNASLIRELKYYSSDTYFEDKTRIQFLHAARSQTVFSNGTFSIIEIASEGEFNTYNNYLLVPHDRKWKIYEYIYTAGQWNYVTCEAISKTKYIELITPRFCNNQGVNSSTIIITQFYTPNSKYPKTVFYDRFSLCKESFFDKFFRDKL